MIDRNGKTALHYATGGHLNSVITLVKNGADIFIPDSNLRKPSRLAFDRKYEQIGSLLENYEKQQFHRLTVEFECPESAPKPQRVMRVIENETMRLPLLIKMLPL